MIKKPLILTIESFKSFLAPRVKEAHKGLFGHVLIIGGSRGMTGAAYLAGEAALRVGAGLVSIAIPDEKPLFLCNSTRPEIMIHGVGQIQELQALLKRATVIVIGPGMGQGELQKTFLKEVLLSPLPKVIDADALNLIAQYPFPSLSAADSVLTPHPGEAGRLLNCSSKEIQANRLNSIINLQQRYHCIIVLKGAGTLICSANTVSLCPLGNPGMASGGMGDVLSGVIGGLLAQGLNTREAAELGVLLHAMAGDNAAEQGGERGMVARDLMIYLRQLIN